MATATGQCASKIRLEIQDLIRQLNSKKATLENLENSCLHEWEEKFTPEYRRGYHMPSDREQGIELGVDSRPAYDVPDRTIDKWTRTCKICGKVQETTYSQDVVHTTKKPSWPGR